MSCKIRDEMQTFMVQLKQLWYNHLIRLTPVHRTGRRQDVKRYEKAIAPMINRVEDEVFLHIQHLEQTIFRPYEYDITDEKRCDIM